MFTPKRRAHEWNELIGLEKAAGMQPLVLNRLRWHSAGKLMRKDQGGVCGRVWVKGIVKNTQIYAGRHTLVHKHTRTQILCR